MPRYKTVTYASIVKEFIVDADNEDEADKKAYDLFMNYEISDKDYVENSTELVSMELIQWFK